MDIPLPIAIVAIILSFALPTIIWRALTHNKE